jgi:hypothetical protein
MATTLVGSSMLVKPEQDLKVRLPMETKLLGSAMLVRPVHPL